MFVWLIFILFAFCFHNFFWKRRKLPPGPVPLPFLGNILEFLRNPPGEQLQLKWRKQYGPIFTFWFGKQPIVAIADYDLIVETFQKDGSTYEGRPNETEYFNLVKGGQLGVVFTEGATWRELRRFSLHFLRDFGLGRNLMQERVLEEIKTLMTRINAELANGSSIVKLDELVDISVGSIINSLMFGYRYTDEKINEFKDLKHRAQLFTQISGHPAQRLIREWPSVYKRLPYFKNRVEEAQRAAQFLFDFFRKRIDEHTSELEELNLQQAPATDFTAAFLQEWKRREEQGESAVFNSRQLVALLFDLWVAGQETTSNTIGWALAYLIHNPEVQEKAREELNRVVGSNRLITIADKSDLPYVAAIVHESQRIANLLPVNLLHRTTRDVEIKGYKLSKGTWIVPQVSVLLCDPSIYPNPDRFQPERFIDKNGKLKRADELLAFSIGKRQCLGEGLARTELFLFISNILNQYKLLPANELPNLKRIFGITVRANPFACCLKKNFN